MTGYAWGSTKLRNPILALARQHRINTVELDIKEEDGIVDFDPHVALATRIGAVQTKYDPVAVVRQLHAMGVRVMGRIVAFNDPKLGAWAWSHGHHDWVIQDGHGHPYVYGYAKSNFTNFANPNVRQYNIDIAKAAVEGRLRRHRLRLHPPARRQAVARCASPACTGDPRSRSPTSPATPRRSCTPWARTSARRSSPRRRCRTERPRPRRTCR